MKIILPFFTALFLLSCGHSPVLREKPPDWPPPMTRTEMAGAPLNSPGRLAIHSSLVTNTRENINPGAGRLRRAE